MAQRVSGTSFDERGRSIDTLARLLDSHRWTMAAMILFIVSVNLLVQQAWRWDPGFLGFGLLFGFLTIIIPVIAAVGVKWMRGLSGPVREVAALSDDSAATWTDEQLGRLLVRWPAFASGVLLLLIGLYSTVTYWMPVQDWRGGLFLVWAGIFFFGYGLLVWAFGAIIALIWRISNLSIHCTPFRLPTRMVDVIYTTYFHIMALGALLYGLAVISVWVSPHGAQIALETSVGNLWVFPPAVIIILFFLTFHFRIHRLLVRYKQVSEDELTRLLDAEYREWTLAPESERADRIDKLLAWRDHVRKADEWPSSLKAVLLTVTTLLIPTIKSIVEVVVG
jgi:hypothetical protein